MTFLPALMQWLHVGSVVLMIGGLFFYRIILIPAIKALPHIQQSQLTESISRRFRIVVWLTLITVLVSGVYNFVSFLRFTRVRNVLEISPDYSLYILILAIKFFIVFLIFTLGIVLTFPYSVFASFQRNPSPWLNLMLILGLIVIFLSTFLRRIPLPEL